MREGAFHRKRLRESKGPRKEMYQAGRGEAEGRVGLGTGGGEKKRVCMEEKGKKKEKKKKKRSGGTEEVLDLLRGGNSS